MKKLKNKPSQIWVDADACPNTVKEIIYKASYRLKIQVILVANSHISIPASDLLRFVLVGKGDDVADKYIVENLIENDLVVTADIPLAALVVEKLGIAINPRGEIYNEENIGEILSMRNFMKELRDGGAVTGGPSTFSAKDGQNFANSLNMIL